MKPHNYPTTYHRQTSQRFQNSDFQNHFSVWKIDLFFPKKHSLKNTGKMCPKFGESDGDII